MNSKVYLLKEMTCPSYDHTKIWFDDIFVFSSLPAAKKELIKRDDEQIKIRKELKRISTIPYSDRTSQEKIFDSNKSNHIKRYTITEKELLDE